jgi:hypothetical protein
VNADGSNTHPRFFMSAESSPLESLSQALLALGCPSEKCLEMAAQLDKRASQLSQSKGRTYAEAMTHLLSLMKQGWAAKEKGL